MIEESYCLYDYPEDHDARNMYGDSDSTLPVIPASSPDGNDLLQSTPDFALNDDMLHLSHSQTQDLFRGLSQDSLFRGLNQSQDSMFRGLSQSQDMFRGLLTDSDTSITRLYVNKITSLSI